MLGIDITKISRFSNKANIFIKRILHPEEILEYKKTLNKELYLASRWAIKEALFKSNNKLNNFNKICIIKKNNQHFLSGYIISTSKEDDYFIAVVQKTKESNWI